MRASKNLQDARERYGYDVVLLDGSVVRLRPIEPDDGDRLRAFGHRLSPESLELRFFHLPDVDSKRIDRLINVDYDDSFALVGEQHDQIVAVGRYARDQRRPEVAEMAFIVDDALQGKGLGTALLDRLAEVARDHGIRAIEGDVIAHNQRMLNMVACSGFEVMHRYDGGLMRLRLDLELTPEYEQRLNARQG